jgi:hypothetical protein
MAPPPHTPNSPSLFEGSDDSRGDTFLILEWGNVHGAATYDVQLTFGVPPQSDIRTSVKAGDRIVGLVPNRAYVIAVRAVDTGGTVSPWSPPLLTATRPPQTLPPFAVRMPDEIPISIGWTIDITGIDRPGTLRVDVGTVFGPASTTPISAVGGPYPVEPHVVSLPDDVGVQFYALRLLDDGSALPGGVINSSYWSSRTPPIRGQSGGSLRPEFGDPLSPWLALRRSYGTRR